MLKSHEKFHSANGRRTILIVDDEAINRAILGNMLEDEYELLFAENGRRALEMIREQGGLISLVLLDLIMPVMNGIEVLTRLREDPETSKIPVIVMTSDQGSEVECLSLGAIDFISKPYPQTEVVRARIVRTIELSEDRDIINSTERDPLTGLYNREFFYRYAEQFDQYHAGLEMDAIVVDVNHFHMINERFGTAYGDDVLRRIGERVREMVLDTGGIVCRREADTFMVYCPHGKDYQAILENASIGLAGDAVESRVRLRMGVYAAADKSLEIERRFDRAKAAADTVRSSFARSIGIYDDTLREKEIFEEQLIEDFHAALAGGQFKVFYQPKFDIRPEIPVLSSAEALVRWFHPDKGMISPGIFIPLFEENGLIQELDEYVWKTTAAQIRDWKDRLGFSVPVSVNVSRIDMYDPGLVDKFTEIVSSSGIGAGELLLEITESAYTKDSEQIVDSVNRLREIGFKIEMDDFGTGYSSLNMISSLPIDALKLDMQFIRSAFSDVRDTRMLEVIIDIADYLKVPVIAEGVETEEQLRALRSMGCDIVQGYYFSRPVPADEYERFVSDRKAADQGSAESGEGDLSDGKHAAQTYRRMSHALSAGYGTIYYIDADTDHYVEFSTDGRYEDMQIEKDGADFFRECRRRIDETVYRDDRSRMQAAMEKRTLATALDDNNSFTAVYRKTDNGVTEYYRLKAIWDNNEKRRHIIVGVSNIDSQISDVEKLEADRMSNVTFSSIARALSRDYFSIYYVDIDTGRFLEYSSDDSVDCLGTGKSGDDFFAACRKSAERLVHDQDRERFLRVFTRDKVRRTLEEKKVFTHIFRLMVNDVPTYVNMKIMRMEDGRERDLVVGISDFDEQMRLEQERARAVRLASRDALTGVKNKYAYDERELGINEQIARGEAGPFAVAVCDLNDLKEVNDTLGHMAGDSQIKAACKTICDVFTHSPVFRIGGDEFVAILTTGDYDNRAELMDQLARINRENKESGGMVVAVGMADYEPGSDRTLSDVFERADAAMYVNKKALKEEAQQI